MREPSWRFLAASSFEVQAGDADTFLLPAISISSQPRWRAQFVLGDLVALGEVGVEIVFCERSAMRGRCNSVQARRHSISTARC